jgi:hypothetical protein
MIACKKCGHENELGRIFCIQCGEKLPLDEIPPPHEKKKFWGKVHHAERKRQGRTFGQIAWRWTKVAILFFLLLCLVLIFVPPDMPRIQKSDAIGTEANRKHKAMLDAIARERLATFELLQDEINSLIPPLDTEGEKGGFAKYHGRARYLEVGDGVVTSYIQGDLAFGSAINLPVVVRLSGQLTVSDNKLHFNETGLFIGRLPIPRLLFPAFRYLMNRVENFWSDENFNTDRALLGRVHSIRAADGKLTIQCAPKLGTPRP